MEWLRSLWFWIRENPWASISGGFLLFGAIGGVVKWCTEIERARREEVKQSKRERIIEATQRKIEKLEAAVTSIAQDVNDPEIVAEAWRRFQKEKLDCATGAGRFGKGRIRRPDA
jgi:hypothetical protein